MGTHDYPRNMSENHDISCLTYYGTPNHSICQYMVFGVVNEYSRRLHSVPGSDCDFYPRVPMGTRGYPRVPTGICQISVGTHGYPRNCNPGLIRRVNWRSLSPFRQLNCRLRKKAWYFTYRRQNGHISHCAPPNDELTHFDAI